MAYKKFVSALNTRYSVMNALQAKRRGITRAITKKLVPINNGSSRGGSGLGLGSNLRGSSIAQGLRVHAHVFHLVECVKRGACTCSPKPRKTNAFATAILAKLRSEHFLPLFSEVPVVVGSLGTRVDIVAARPAFGTEVLIEVKTGNMSDEWNGYSRFREPLNHVPYTRVNHAWVQILATRAMCRNAYGVDPDDIYLVIAARDSAKKKIVARILAAPLWTKDASLGGAILAKLLEPVRKIDKGKSKSRVPMKGKGRKPKSGKRS